MVYLNWSTTLIMYHEKNTSTNYTTQCTLNVSSFLKYAGTFVVILGLVGNCLSILVFSRKALRSRSCSMYFLGLSVSDMSVLLGYTVENLLFHGYGLQLLSNAFMCKSIIFLIYASTDISNYLLTLAAIDRAVLVSNSLARARFCRKSMAKLLISSVVALFSLINSHFLFGFHVDHTGACLPIASQYIHFYVHHYDSYIDIIKTVLVPFLVIFICNTFIISRFTHRQNSLAGSAFRRPSSRRREKDRQLTWFLLSTSILFVLLSLPSEINDFVRSHLSERFQIRHLCELWASTSLFILVHQINHASHFYVYTLTGPIFRKELRKVIFCLRKQSKTNDLLKYVKRASLTVRYSQREDLHDRCAMNERKPTSV